MNLSVNRYATIVTILLALAAVEIFYLVIQNRRLRSIIDDPHQYFATIQPATDVPALRGVDLSGAPLNISYGPGEPSTLICWFSTTCGVCEENVPFWNRLAAEFTSPNLRIVGMCNGDPDAARAYIERTGLAFPVLALTDDYLIEAYGGNLVPQTIMISPAGTVEANWPGALQTSQHNAILALVSDHNRHISMEGGEAP